MIWRGGPTSCDKFEGMRDGRALMSVCPCSGGRASAYGNNSCRGPPTVELECSDPEEGRGYAAYHGYGLPLHQISPVVEAVVRVCGPIRLRDPHSPHPRVTSGRDVAGARWLRVSGGACLVPRPLCPYMVIITNQGVWSLPCTTASLSIYGNNH